MDTTLTAEEPSKSHSWTLQHLNTLFQVQSNHHLMELCKTSSGVKPIGTTNRAASPKPNVELRLPDRCPDEIFHFWFTGATTSAKKTPRPPLVTWMRFHFWLATWVEMSCFKSYLFTASLSWVPGSVVRKYRPQQCKTRRCPPGKQDQRHSSPWTSWTALGIAHWYFQNLVWPLPMPASCQQPREEQLIKIKANHHCKYYL